MTIAPDRPPGCVFCSPNPPADGFRLDDPDDPDDPPMMIPLRDRLAYRLASAALRLATPRYRAFIGGSIRYGMNAAARDALDRVPPPRPWRGRCTQGEPDMTAWKVIAEALRQGQLQDGRKLDRAADEDAAAVIAALTDHGYAIVPHADLGGLAKALRELLWLSQRSGMWPEEETTTVLTLLHGWQEGE